MTVISLYVLNLPLILSNSVENLCQRRPTEVGHPEQAEMAVGDVLHPIERDNMRVLEASQRSLSMNGEPVQMQPNRSLELVRS